MLFNFPVCFSLSVKKRKGFPDAIVPLHKPTQGVCVPGMRQEYSTLECLRPLSHPDTLLLSMLISIFYMATMEIMAVWGL